MKTKAPRIALMVSGSFFLVLSVYILFRAPGVFSQAPEEMRSGLVGMLISGPVVFSLAVFVATLILVRLFEAFSRLRKHTV